MRLTLSLGIAQLCAALSAAHAAQAAPAPPPPSGGKPVPSCVDVEVDGYRSVSYDCLGQQMAPAVPPNRPNPAMSSQDITRRAPNQAGLATPATTANRMGGNFGNSAFAQRPPPPASSRPSAPLPPR
ncbi:hypothetical protein V8Z80_04940 [Orrella sp. JC864]|uniref:hypothetical protein n=1 Tax=Orrella sp. JC864 TaxID=3120298 RepID=UPI0012BC4507